MRRKGQPRQPNRSFVDADGVRWHSRAEYGRWKELQILERAGLIQNLTRQVRVDLYGPNGVLRARKSKRVRHMVIDFRFFENNRTVYEDWKGHAEDAWQLKADLFCNMHPNTELRISGRKA